MFCLNFQFSFLIQPEDNLTRLKCQDLSNAAWAFAVLGLKHERFFEAAKDELIRRTDLYLQGNVNVFTRFQCQEISNLIWAFGTLNISYPGLTATAGKYIIQLTSIDMQNLDPKIISRTCKRLELMCVAWTCAVLGQYENDLMKFLYAGLVGIGSQPDIDFLNECYGDSGLQGEAIMSLIYVQLAMELETSNNDLALPNSFPDNWGQRSDSRGDSSAGDIGMNELQLSTSKIQRDVSAAFDRIGFEHVQEHIMLLNELLTNQGIPLSPTPLEVLSLDIANVDARIGIEVDGPAHYVTDIEKEPRKCGKEVVVNGRLAYEFNMDHVRQQVNGATALKNRLLRQLGWKVINIPFWEWYELNEDEEAENAYCRALLNNVQ